MTTDTQAAVAAALMQAANCRHTYGLKDPDDAYGVNTVVYVSRDAILALITPDAMAALEAERDKARRKVADVADELLNAATELAQYASYSEIVGAISHNRVQIREWCDKVFDIRNRLPEDENYEPSFAAMEARDVKGEGCERGADGGI